MRTLEEASYICSLMNPADYIITDDDEDNVGQGPSTSSARPATVINDSGGRFISNKAKRAIRKFLRSAPGKCEYINLEFIFSLVVFLLLDFFFFVLV
jgi:hypothetical protein